MKIYEVLRSTSLIGLVLVAWIGITRMQGEVIDLSGELSQYEQLLIRMEKKIDTLQDQINAMSEEDLPFNPQFDKSDNIKTTRSRNATKLQQSAKIGQHWILLGKLKSPHGRDKN